MNRGYSGGKRQREANRDKKKKEKEQRLQQHREDRARGIEPLAQETIDLTTGAATLPEVKLEDVVIGVVPRPRRASFGPTRLFVGGLSADTTSEGLREAFAKFGAISEAAVIPDRATGRSRGFGFVAFDNSADAEAAAKGMNGAELDGRTLKVNRAEAR
jgi:hypothetical protein